MLLKARSSHVSCETSPFRALANLKKLGGWHKDFRQLIVFHWYLKSREFWVSSTHWTGLCILKPETVSPSCRDIIVSMFWQMMRACFDFLGGKNWGEARPPSVLPKAAVLSSHHVSFLEQSSKSQSFTPSRL